MNIHNQETPPRDPDTEAVLQIFQGASRGALDPDAELAQLLSALEQADESALMRALERLSPYADKD